MDHEVILESPTLRNSLCNEKNVPLLEKVKELITLPHSGWTTKENVAKFYEVSTDTLGTCVKRHKKELEQDGYKVLSKEEFIKIHKENPGKNFRRIAVFQRRAVLRCAMLLRDSKVAGQIRDYLLNLEQAVMAQERDPLEMVAAQARLITVLADEMYRNRQNIEKHQKRVNQKIEEMEFDIQSIKHQMGTTASSKKSEPLLIMEPKESFKSADTNQPISKDQAKKLSSLVKEGCSNKKDVIRFWHRFKKEFDVTRYVHLPKGKYKKAIKWIKNNLT